MSEAIDITGRAMVSNMWAKGPGFVIQERVCAVEGRWVKLGSGWFAASECRINPAAPSQLDAVLANDAAGIKGSAQPR